MTRVRALFRARVARCGAVRSGRGAQWGLAARACSIMVDAKASSASFCSSTSRIADSTFTSSSDIVS